jgi:multiple sugar transport system permease protein
VSTGTGLAAPDVPERMRRRFARRHLMGRVGLYVLAVLAAFCCAGPFLWSAMTATKLKADLFGGDNNPLIYNQEPTIDHVRFLLVDTDFPTFLWNTFWVGALVVVITLLLGVPAAYAIARLNRPWSGPMGIAIFFVYLIPPSLLFLSLTRVVVWLDLYNSTWSLVVIYPTITVPVSTWLLIGFLKALPKDIEEQAMVDGYSRLGAFFRTVVPLLFPGMVAVVVFAFTLAASEFLYALSFISATDEKIVSTGVAQDLILGDVYHWQELQAANILVAVPIAFIFNLFLARFVSGFTMGAVKG